MSNLAQFGHSNRVLSSFLSHRHRFLTLSIELLHKFTLSYQLSNFWDAVHSTKMQDIILFKVLAEHFEKLCFANYVYNLTF